MSEISKMEQDEEARSARAGPSPKKMARRDYLYKRNLCICISRIMPFVLFQKLKQSTVAFMEESNHI